MPAYAYPEPDELTAFRGLNPGYSIWEALAQITTNTSSSFSGSTVNNIIIADSQGSVWQLTVDTDGITTTTKLETTPEAPTSINFWTPQGIFALSIDTDGSLLTTPQE